MSSQLSSQLDNQLDEKLDNLKETLTDIVMEKVITKEVSTEIKEDIEPLKGNKTPSESLPSVTNDDKQGTEIKSHEDAITKAKELHGQGLSYTAIADELSGKYYTAKRMTQWSGTQVSRILKKEGLLSH